MVKVRRCLANALRNALIETLQFTNKKVWFALKSLPDVRAHPVISVVEYAAQTSAQLSTTVYFRFDEFQPLGEARQSLSKTIDEIERGAIDI